MPSLTIVQAIELDPSLDNEFFLAVERSVKEGQINVLNEGDAYMMQVSSRLCVNSNLVGSKLLITINAIDVEDMNFDYLKFSIELSRIYKVIRTFSARQKTDYKITVRELVENSMDGHQVFLVRNIGEYLAVSGLLDEEDHSGYIPSGHGKIFPEIAVVDRSGLMENLYTYSLPPNEELTETDPLTVGGFHKREIAIREFFINTKNEDKIIERLMSFIETRHNGKFELRKTIHSQTGRTYSLGIILMDFLDLPNGTTKIRITADTRVHDANWETGPQLKCVYDALHGHHQQANILHLSTIKDVGIHQCYRVGSPAQFLDLCAHVKDVCAKELSKTRFPCFVTIMEIHGDSDVAIVSI